LCSVTKSGDEAVMVYTPELLIVADDRSQNGGLLPLGNRIDRIGPAVSSARQQVSLPCAHQGFLTVSTSRLPPLNALRAFEAVARHRSFRKAAEELFVTPAAITHQIKSLESQLGIQLFIRLSRKIELTEAAQASLPALQQGFDALTQAVSELHRHGNIPHLTIGTTPTFVSRWLMPRLHRFLTQHPGINVNFVVSGQLVAASPRSEASARRPRTIQETDIDIRFSSESPDEQHADLLFEVEIVPMCHPHLLAGPPPLNTPSDLRHQTLLHSDGQQSDREQSAWALWLRQAGVFDVDPRRGLQLEHSTLALEAAVDELGVTLAMPMLVADELAANKLAVAFPISLPLNSAYYVITPKDTKPCKDVAAFRDWVIAEARAASA